jgi:hypothetical protein
VLDLLSKLYKQIFNKSSDKENSGGAAASKPAPVVEASKPAADDNKKKFGMDFNDSDDDNDAEDLAKSIQPAQNQPLRNEKANNDKHKLNDFEDDFGDEDDHDDPWNLDSKSKPAASKPVTEVKPVAAAASNANKNNPFEQKVKPAFDDLEDIGFDLDSDRPIEFNNNKNKGGVEANKPKDLFGELSKNKNQNDQDNGLFVDNDFGDELEDNYEDDFNDDDSDHKNKSQKLGGMLGAAANKAAAKDSHHNEEDDEDEDDIFENSRTKENKPALS